MFQEMFHQLLGIISEQPTWQDYTVAAVGAVIFLMLKPIFRSLFFSLKRSARIAKTASMVRCVELAALQTSQWAIARLSAVLNLPTHQHDCWRVSCARSAFRVTRIKGEVT